MNPNPTLLWFRRDLRLADHPALLRAGHRGGPVIPIFIWSPEEEGGWPPGGASCWWLHHSLLALSRHLEACGSRFVIRPGPARVALTALAQETQASGVFWSRRYEPAATSRDHEIKESLRAAGLEAESFNSALLFEPWTIQNKSGRPFQFFTPFWRHCLTLEAPAAPIQAPRAIAAPEFGAFPWRSNPAWLRAWQQGRTGFPIVDAGMRQLWRTGWMHNRVRMIAASFLVKDLLINWTEGARWFWDTLVDADLAQNTLGWQWTAGCGADAAPYFRVFNPTTQGEKFDPEGNYVRRWVPELARLPAPWIHRPHEAPPAVLAQAAVRPGENYPFPIVSHVIARNVALEAFAQLRR